MVKLNYKKDTYNIHKGSIIRCKDDEVLTKKLKNLAAKYESSSDYIGNHRYGYKI